MSNQNHKDDSAAKEARTARLQALGETAEGIRLDSPASAQRWNEGERPSCGICGIRASWSTSISAWIHMSPAFVDGEWKVVDADHSVGEPTWGPR